ncbi:MAG: hypothetical protein CMB99_04500 [Flavobacteriaceae bacterium]|nr:hypothetical protein [Flavobacteriaceae bacterium]|tara:strand:+ start:33788 stop:34150 length:363 start_codon:yes stop_codon:yes gene_type:complete
MKKVLLGIGFLFVIVFVLIFRPVPIVAEENALESKGVVTEIYGTGGFDVVFKLDNTSQRYYINRGLEHGRLDLKDLQNRLIGQEVIIKYPKYWTPLDWNNTVRHLSKLEFGDEVIFNELK